jgi:tRNA(Ile)-lysidine synthase
VRVDDQWSLVVTHTTLQALPATWRSQLDPWQAVLDATQLGQPVLTTPRPGDVFAPLGMDGHHKTLGDFFTDRKVPTALRPGWPIIVDQSSGATLWVCGHQPSHCARITEKTQVVLRLAWTLNDARSE